MKLAASQDGFLVHYFVHRTPIEKCMPARISRSWRVRHRISAIRRLEDVGSPETIHPFLIAIFQFAAHLHFFFCFFFFTELDFVFWTPSVLCVHPTGFDCVILSLLSNIIYSYLQNAVLISPKRSWGLPKRRATFAFVIPSSR